MRIIDRDSFRREEGLLIENAAVELQWMGGTKKEQFANSADTW